ncbi:hypothetical protein ACWEKR_28285 [Nocardia sp. NPDC004573]
MAPTNKRQKATPTRRARHGVREDDRMESMEVDGTSRVLSADDVPIRGQRLVQRLHGTAGSGDVAGMSTDQIMHLLRGE